MEGGVLVVDGDIRINLGNTQLEDGDVILEDGDVILEDGDVLLEDGNLTLEDGDISLYEPNPFWGAWVNIHGSGVYSSSFVPQGQLNFIQEESAPEWMESCGTINFGFRENDTSAKTNVAYIDAVSYTHLRAHQTDSNVVCRLQL